MGREPHLFHMFFAGLHQRTNLYLCGGSESAPYIGILKAAASFIAISSSICLEEDNSNTLNRRCSGLASLQFEDPSSS